jgi:hypothetical protein
MNTTLEEKTLVPAPAVWTDGPEEAMVYLEVNEMNEMNELQLKLDQFTNQLSNTIDMQLKELDVSILKLKKSINELKSMK